MLVPKIRNPVGIPEMEREQAGMHPKNRKYHRRELIIHEQS